MSEQTSSEETTQTQEELPAMEGGLPDVPTESDVETGEVEQAEPVYSSSAGEFKSVDDLKSYTRSLEKRAIEGELGSRTEQKATPQILNEGSGIQDKVEEDPSLEDLILTDTSRAVGLMKAELRKEMQKETAVVEQRREFYDNLYSQNPILQPYKDVVQLIVQRDTSELSAMTLPKAQEEIKKRTLKFVGGVAERTGGKIKEQRVKGGSSEVLTPSTGHPAQTNVSKQQKPLSFADQVKILRSKRSG